MNNLQEAIRRLQLNNKLVVLRCRRGSGERQLLSGLTQGYTTVDLSLPKLHMQARQNPAFFLRSLPLPAHLANLQYAPFLLAHIVESGLPLEHLLGSCTQGYYLEEAGLQRVAFLELPLAGGSDEGEAFVPEAARLRALAERETDIFAAVLQSRVDGGAAAYVRHFLQCDIMERTTVSDEVKFYRFLCVAASMCGRVVNYSGLAANVGVTAPWEQGLYPIYIRLDKFYAHKLAKTSEIVRPCAVRERLELRPGCVFTLGGGCAPVNDALWQVNVSRLQYD